MNLHLITIGYLSGFIAVCLLIAWGLNVYPVFTLTTFALVMFGAFYHLVYTFVKLEQTMKEFKSK
jgi:uncharacterized membrane protein